MLKYKQKARKQSWQEVSEMKINEVSKMYDITADTLRYYECIISGQYWLEPVLLVLIIIPLSGKACKLKRETARRHLSSCCVLFQFAILKFNALVVIVNFII